MKITEKQRITVLKIKALKDRKMICTYYIEVYALNYETNGVPWNNQLIEVRVVNFSIPHSKVAQHPT